MDLSLEMEDVPKMFNYYVCRFCIFDANGVLELLQNHYQEHHPVTTANTQDTIEYHQAGGLIAVQSKNHKHCCFENCPNNQTSVIRKKAFKLAVRLKHGGLYPQLDDFFDDHHYNQEPFIFACSDLFLHSAKYNADLLIRWISQFGLMRTFALRDVVKKKNKNLLLVKRVPKVKDQLQQQIKTLTNETQMSQIVGVKLATTVELQAGLLQTKMADTVWKEKEDQIADFMRTFGYKMSFDKDNKLVINICEVETEKVYVPSPPKKKFKCEEEIPAGSPELETINENEDPLDLRFLQ